MKKINQAMITLSIIMLNTVTVFGDIDISDLDTAVGFRWIFNRVMGLITGLGVVSLSICLVRYITADSEQDAADAKKSGKLVITAWIVGTMFGVVISAFFAFISGMEI